MVYHQAAHQAAMVDQIHNVYLQSHASWLGSVFQKTE